MFKTLEQIQFWYTQWREASKLENIILKYFKILFSNCLRSWFEPIWIDIEAQNWDIWSPVFLVTLFSLRFPANKGSAQSSVYGEYEVNTNIIPILRTWAW